MVQAWGIYDAILKDDRFQFYSEPSELGKTLRQLTQSNRASSKPGFGSSPGFGSLKLLEGACDRTILRKTTRDITLSTQTN